LEFAVFAIRALSTLKLPMTSLSSIISINTPDTRQTPAQGQLVTGLVPSERGLALWSQLLQACAVDPHFAAAWGKE
jgi:hypothetical protein